jgi:chemotaxis-related protein WspD
MTQPHVSTGRLFDREMPEDDLHEWTSRVAAKRSVIEVGRKSVVIFKIATEWLALPTEVFQEVVDQFVVRTLPHQRGGILSGLVNVRGELLLCVALQVLLGLEKVGPVQQRDTRTSQGRLLICNRKGDRLAFRADEVYGVQRYHPGDLRDVPATLAKAAAGAYVAAILPWNDRTVGCLDEELLFYALNKGFA